MCVWGAVLKIDAPAQALRPVSLGSSADLQVRPAVATAHMRVHMHAHQRTRETNEVL